MSNVTVLKHPVVDNCLRYLRDKDADIVQFRRSLKHLGLFLAMEATADLPTRQYQVETPLNITADVAEAADDTVLLIPILRAGLGFVESFLEVIPRAKVAHIGMARDHETLEAKVYLSTLPKNVDVYQRVYVMDPMLATGNSCVKTLDILVEGGIKPESIVVACAFAAPEGINQVHSRYPQVKIIAATVDKKLNEVGYIIPGCGDAGDRLYLL
ncbi:uracil phosphoribosyltransferase [Desulfohalotomaculum tongense]|uniref:uracil phosphoribosyltransferase n=1 Tax=Desulforadius tongensis TaxID=1216062 RepID=UPI00195AB751|nr:uracil phosphoribosyltransferase [Desulforadius tongensis]MBM7855392.1 uracil phosphoribosyltransferase [Desulforadius tongensis]